MNAGERRAARHYLLRGWRLVGSNERVGRNELDLIVRRGRRLIIVEVKEKTGDRYGDPLEMVDAEKLRRVRRTAQAWLAAHPELAALDLGFEVVGVSPGRLERVRVEAGDEGA
ncbi:MAG: YraN family protein [Gaiellaceae bacterium]